MKAYITSATAISPQDTFNQGIFSGSALIPPTPRMKCLEPDYKEILNPALSRRMSRIVKMGVAAALKSLKAAGIEKPGAIITGTGLGCLEDTGNFLASMIKNKEQFLTPTAFIQSTHNTIAGQIALLLKCNEYNFAYVHRGFSFEHALMDSLLMLENGEAEQILLGGIDEITNDYYALTARLGFWKNELPQDTPLLHSKTRGTIAGEGSVFFTLDRNPANAWASFDGLEMIYKPASAEVIARAAEQLLQQAGIGVNELDAVMFGYNGWKKHDGWYAELSNGLFAGKALLGFKHLCGEYMTASSFAAWLAATILKNGKIPAGVQLSGPTHEKQRYILIYNHYMGIDHSLMLLRAC